MRHAQVEVGIQVEDEDALRGWQRLRDTLEGAPGHLVPAAQHQGQAALRPGLRHVLAQCHLCRFQRALRAVDVAHVPQRGLAQHGQVGQRLARNIGAMRSAHAPGVAAHAFVHGKSDQGHAALAGGGKGLHPLVPARAGAGFLGIDAALPGKGRAHGGLLQRTMGSLRPCFLAVAMASS